MLPDIQPGNTKILYFFNCLLDGMHTTSLFSGVCPSAFALNETAIMNAAQQPCVL